MLKKYKKINPLALVSFSGILVCSLIMLFAILDDIAVDCPAATAKAISCCCFAFKKGKLGINDGMKIYNSGSFNLPVYVEKIQKDKSALAFLLNRIKDFPVLVLNLFYCLDIQYLYLPHLI
jgi:hypothetical protein